MQIAAEEFIAEEPGTALILPLARITSILRIAKCGAMLGRILPLAALLTALCLSLATPAAAQAPNNPKYPPIYYKAMDFCNRKGAQLGDKYELKEQPQIPAWTRNEPEPLFRFVHMTDCHYCRRVHPYFVKALDMVANEIRPAFVAITGDNAGSSDVAKQRAFKQLLEQHLRGVPYFIVRGDNWPQNFTKVFGDADWSFVCGGVGFVGASIDRDIINLGIGVFDDDTYGWILRRLDAHKGRPVIYFMHENFMPPSFLDAPRLLAQLQARPWVVATVTGHLHYDYETRVRGIVHIVGPAFGPRPQHAFKVFNAHPDHFTVRTIKWRGGRFQYVTLYQRIDFPPGVRLEPPADPKQRAEWLKISAYTAPPRKEIVVDPALANRITELIVPALSFIPLTGRANEVWADLGELAGELQQALMAAAPGANAAAKTQ